VRAHRVLLAPQAGNDGRDLPARGIVSDRLAQTSQCRTVGHVDTRADVETVFRQGNVVPAADAGCDEGLVWRLAARESHVAVDTRQLARAVGRRELGQQTLHRCTTGAL